MYVSHILTGVENLGPGKRLCVWFAGCSKKCAGCCSPELKTREHAVQIGAEDLADLVNYKAAVTGAQGITLSGGDPLEQPDIIPFLQRLILPDVMLFTGYNLTELKTKGICDRIGDYVAVLKCGRYVPGKDKGHPLMGSANQKLVFFKPEYRDAYEKYINEHKRKLSFYRLNNNVYFSGLPDHNKKGAD